MEQEVIVGGQVFVPRYSGEDYRSRKRDSILTNEDGTIRAIYLEGIRFIHTPIGNIKAEYVTFYPSGAIKRIFPSFGQISGYWSEEEEMALVDPIDISVHYQVFRAKYSCIHFYESGAVKSLTLCPAETIIVKAPSGKMKVRNGISFYESGKIKSLEPDKYIVVYIGDAMVTAYDNTANGISGDTNSLVFDEDGSIKSLMTPVSSFLVINQEGKYDVIQPKLKRNPLDIDLWIPYPMKVMKDNNKIIIIDSDQKKTVVDTERFSLRTTQILDYLKYIECGNCSECNGCKNTM